MPRIIVTSDEPAPNDGAAVLLDLRVRSAQLSEGEHASQFIERLGWAISDAEDAAGISNAAAAPLAPSATASAPSGAAVVAQGAFRLAHPVALFVPKAAA